MEVYSYIVKPDFPNLFFTVVFYSYTYSGYTSAYVQHMSLAGGAELEGAVDVSMIRLTYSC